MKRTSDADTGSSAQVLPFPVPPLREFTRSETAGGVVLLAAAAVALAWANSPAADSYERLWWHTTVTLRPPGMPALTHDLRHWVNESLMVLFFFVVGLEIKRELVAGELREPKAAALPAVAALAGVALPALLFLSIAGTAVAAGWGIPVATDIAFALGVLSVLGSRVPAGAKLFLLSVAIVDDLVAIVLIAVFYSDAVHMTWLLAAALPLGVVAAMRHLRITAIPPCVLAGLALWLLLLESGIHATLAGVATAMLTPAHPVAGRDVMAALQHRLHPISAFVVVPLFALANAGVDLHSALPQGLHARLTWAVAIALVVGKTIGIAGTSLVACRLGIGLLPSGLTACHLWGLGMLAGMGFTVSLFITDLAFRDQTVIDQAKVGIFTGSLFGAVLGTVTLLAVTHRSRPPEHSNETHSHRRGSR